MCSGRREATSYRIDDLQTNFRFSDYCEVRNELESAHTVNIKYMQTCEMVAAYNTIAAHSRKSYQDGRCTIVAGFDVSCSQHHS